MRPSRLPASFRTTYGLAGEPVLQVWRELRPHLVGACAGDDFDPRSTKPGDALAAHVRVGVLDADDDTRDARSDDRVDTGRRAAVMRARLEGRSKRCAAGGLRLPTARRRPRRVGRPGARSRLRRSRRPRPGSRSPPTGSVRCECERSRQELDRSLHQLLVAGSRGHVVLVRRTSRSRGRRHRRPERVRSSEPLPRSHPDSPRRRAGARRGGTPSALGFHQVGQRPEGRRFAGSHRRSGLTPIPREGVAFVRL